jgi:hypothetical protein
VKLSISERVVDLEPPVAGAYRKDVDLTCTDGCMMQAVWTAQPDGTQLLVE